VFLKTWHILAIGAVAGAAALCSCSDTSSAHSTASATRVHEERKLAPDFTLQDANGTSVSLSGYRGKTVLLNFWATWCGPCAMEIPWFIEFEQQFKSKGFEVVGISMDEDGWSAIKPYIAEHKVNYRVLLGNDSVSQLYGGVDSLPTTFLLDRAGKVAYVHVGLAGKNEYLNEIQTLLGSKQASVSRAALHTTIPALLVPGTAK
jgi:peroxiredoxin